MGQLIAFIIPCLVTAISLLIISKLPTGVEIDSFGKALISAVVFGILNTFVKPVLGFLGFPIVILTFGLFLLVINAIVFGLAAWLVPGFRLRWGIWSALIGAFALTIINSLLSQFLTTIL